MNIKWSFGVLLGGLALSFYYFINNNSTLAFAFLLAGILTPVITSANLYGSYLLGKKDFRKHALFGIVRNIIPPAAIIIALVLTQHILVIIAAYFIVTALTTLCLYYLTARSQQNDVRAEDPGLSSYSGHLSLMEFTGQMTAHLDKILIFHYLGAAPLAVYAFAIAPVEQLQGGKKILSTLVAPKLNERTFEELQQSSPGKSLLLTVYAFGLAGVYILLAPYFYQFFFPQYLDSVFYSQVYALTLLAVSGTMFNETLIAHKKKRELYVHRTVVPLTQMGLFVVLLPIYGLLGLIMTHVCVRIFSGLLSYYFVQFPFSRNS